jgi:hypothetical protein
MNPGVEAAIVAAGVGLLTLAGNIYGTRKAAKDTDATVRKHLAVAGLICGCVGAAFYPFFG